MFSYQQISRWLDRPSDPVTVEDFVANREMFGTEEAEEGLEDDLAKELGLAYQIEKAREEKPEISKSMPLEVILNGLAPTGIIELEDFVIVAPSGRVVPAGKQVLEVQVVGEESGRKIKVNCGEIVRITVPKEATFGLYVRAFAGFKIGSSNVSKWNGSGKKYLIIDARGRPLPILEGEKNRAQVLKWREQMAHDSST